MVSSAKRDWVSKASGQVCASEACVTAQEGGFLASGPALPPALPFVSGRLIEHIDAAGLTGLHSTFVKAV
jgi:hypothetical protein